MTINPGFIHDTVK